MVTRRQLLAGAAGLAGTLAVPGILRAQRSFRDYPFALGLCAGDPSPDGFVIWTRIAPQPLEPHGGTPLAPVPVRWEVAEDDRFRDLAASGEVLARPEIGHSVHVEVAGLRPGRSYWYRFSAAGERSPVGRARTLPPPGSSPEALRFGVCGCQNYEDGHYTALRHLAAEDLAFVFHYGDFIYETSRAGPGVMPWGTPLPKVRSHVGQECFDLADYRRRYAQYLSDPDLQAARAAQTWFSTFDDHEVANNWAAEIDGRDAPSDLFLLRRQAAFQAWYEFMPVRRSLLPRAGALTMYRDARFGDLLALNLLDTRSYRTDQPCGDGFKPRCPDMADPAAHMVAARQEEWLHRNLTQGGARWNCIAQQVMMMPLDRRMIAGQPETIYNLDSWAGYEAPRRRLLAGMRGLGNVVVLTGDEHQNFAGLLDDGDRAVAVEFVSTSISSGGDGSDRRFGSDRMLANNPQLRFVNDQRGYLTCDVNRDEWRTSFMVVDRVSSPGAPIARRATATVARGRPDLTIA